MFCTTPLILIILFIAAIPLAAMIGIRIAEYAGDSP